GGESEYGSCVRPVSHRAARLCPCVRAPGQGEFGTRRCIDGEAFASSQGDRKCVGTIPGIRRRREAIFQLLQTKFYWPATCDGCPGILNWGVLGGEPLAKTTGQRHNASSWIVGVVTAARNGVTSVNKLPAVSAILCGTQVSLWCHSGVD